MLTKSQCGFLGANLGMALITYVDGPQSVTDILGMTVTAGIIMVFWRGLKREAPFHG